MSKLHRVTLTAAAILISTGLHAADAIDYPGDYRQWTHAKSMTVHAGHALETPFKGIHHVYANAAAVDGLRGGEYADGASFAFDQFAYVTRDKLSTEGKRVLLGVMVKDRARFPDTGGWGFEAWAGDSRSQRLVNDGGQSCYGCHTQVEKRGYVFTEWRD